MLSNRLLAVDTPLQIDKYPSLTREQLMRAVSEDPNSEELERLARLDSITRSGLIHRSNSYEARYKAAREDPPPITDNFSNIKNLPPLYEAAPDNTWMGETDVALVTYLMKDLPQDASWCQVVNGELEMVIDKDTRVTDVFFRSGGDHPVTTLYLQGLWHKYNPDRLPYKFLLAEIDRLCDAGYAFAVVHVHLWGPWFPEKVGHANALYVDLKNRIVEYYEPHGWIPFLHNTLLTLTRVFKDYTINCPALKCPLQLGPQARGRKHDQGWCKTYSALYVIYRILNPTVQPDRIAKYIGRGTPEDIRNRMLKIQGYALAHKKNLSYINYQKNWQVKKAVTTLNNVYMTEQGSKFMRARWKQDANRPGGVH